MGWAYLGFSLIWFGLAVDTALRGGSLLVAAIQWVVSFICMVIAHAYLTKPGANP